MHTPQANPPPAERAAGDPARAAHYAPLVTVLLAACSGVVADRFLDVSVGLWWALAAAALAAWLAAILLHRNRLAAATVLLALAAAMGGWHGLRWSLFPGDDLGLTAGREPHPVCLEGIAAGTPLHVAQPPPDPMRVFSPGPSCQFPLEVTAVRDGVRWRPAGGRMRLRVWGELPNLAAGDRLRVFAQVEAPRRATNPGQFDYALHLRASRTLALLEAKSPACVQPLTAGRGELLQATLDRLRRRAEAAFQRHLGPAEAGMASTMLLGRYAAIDREEIEAFQATGTVHLLAVSGLHLALLVGPIWLVLRRLPLPGWATDVAVGGLTAGYVLVTEMRTPVLRAAALVFVLLIARRVRRPASAWNSLAAAGLVVLWFNPADLFQVGAQLSFLAVGTMIHFAPLWTAPPPDEPRPLPIFVRDWLALALRPPARFFWRLTLVSLAIWAVALPLVLGRFHLFTPVSVVTNPVVWLPAWAALTSGFALATLGSLHPLLGAPLGWLCTRSFSLLAGLVHGFESVPYGHWWLPGPPAWWLAGFYGALIAAALWPAVRPPRRWAWGLLAGWMAAGFGWSLAGEARGELRCTVLDVGHGCATVVELPDGRTLLYDAGRLGFPEPAAEAVSNYLWSRGRLRIDAVVLSHCDTDHFNALPRLLRRFDVGAVYVSPFMFEAGSYTGESLRQSIRQAGVPLAELRAGDRLAAGPCRIEVFHPPQRGILGSDNANSVVLVVEHLGRSVLLAGDLEPPGLHALLAEEPCDCDVLLSPHHGSRRSNAPELLAWCRPEWLLVSGAATDPSPPLPPSTTLLRTHDVGAITVEIAPDPNVHDLGSLHVTTQLPP